MILPNKIRRIIFMVNRASYRRRTQQGGADIVLPDISLLPTEQRLVDILDIIPAGNDVSITVFGTVDAIIDIPVTILSDILVGTSQNVPVDIIDAAPAGNDVSVQVFGTVDLLV